MTGIDSLRGSVDDMIARGDLEVHGEHRDVLEAFRMVSNDRGWVRRMHEAIANGLTAEAAVEKVQSDTRAQLQRQTDPYLWEHLHDFFVGAPSRFRRPRKPAAPRSDGA